MHKILVINGPNLNLLGSRELHVYGTATLEEISASMTAVSEQEGLHIDFFQSNHEGEIIDKIQDAMDMYSGIIINPGAFTHYSYAIRDALAAVNLPVIEVHLTNIYNREEFRQRSVIAPVALGQICGLGAHGYIASLYFMIRYLNGKEKTSGVQEKA